MQKDFDVTINVDPSLFIKESLLKDITQEERTLANGTKALCYVITTASQPQEHSMGPWCPAHIEDGKDKGGIWFKDGKVYDVDGHFIANLKEFYSDEEWALFREDGSLKSQKPKKNVKRQQDLMLMKNIIIIVLNVCQIIIERNNLPTIFL